MESGKIFVGGLDWSTEKESLRNHFAGYGEVTDCVVMKNLAGKSRGFGFVTFADPDAVTVVLSKKHTIDGRNVDAKPCSARGSSNGANKGGRPAFTGRTTKIFIGGLPNDATEDNLKTFFQKYGDVTDVVIMMDNEKMRPRGFGFLTFNNEDAVEEAVKEHFVDFHGKKIELKRAEPRQGRKQNFNNEQGWGDGWNQNQGGYGGGYGQGGNNSFGGYGNQGYDQSWGQGQYGGGQNWGQNQGGYNNAYGQGGYNQQGYGQGYGGNQGGYGGNQGGYGGAQGGYGGAQGGYGGNQGYGGGSQGYSGGAQGGYGGGNQGGYGGGNQSGYGGQQNNYGGGSQDNYGGGKSASNSGSQGGYHPYKR